MPRLLAQLRVCCSRLWVVVSVVLVVALLPSRAWAVSDDAGATTSPPSPSSSTAPSSVDPSDTGSSTSPPSPTPTEPSEPSEPVEVLVEFDQAVVSLAPDQWSTAVSFGWAYVVGLALLVLVGSAGVIASFGRGSHVA